MERRAFLRNGMLASAGAVLTTGSLAAGGRRDGVFDSKPFHLNYGFHQGMFKHHAGESFLDQIRFGHEQGFRSIEDNGMMSRSDSEQEKIGNLLAKLGMTMGVFVITSDSWHWKKSLTTGKQEWLDKMEQDCRRAIEVAKRCNAKWVTVVPGNFERALPLEIQTANVVEALRRASDILEPQGITMVLEPLSDNPDLFLRTSLQTYLICKAVNRKSCKILYDIYHMQRNEGDLIANMARTWDEIAYIQIGDNPGRKEPTTGEINYKNVFKFIHDKGYKGVMGMEHGLSGSGKEGEQALIRAYRECDNFL